VHWESGLRAGMGAVCRKKITPKIGARSSYRPAGKPTPFPEAPCNTI